MDRQARRTYFERLCQLRDAYSRRGAEDTTSVISIEATIEHAIRLLDQPTSPLIVMLDGGGQTA